VAEFGDLEAKKGQYFGQLRIIRLEHDFGINCFAADGILFPQPVKITDA